MNFKSIAQLSFGVLAIDASISANHIVRFFINIYMHGAIVT
jgi:hypothetical protein